MNKKLAVYITMVLIIIWLLTGELERELGNEKYSNYSQEVELNTWELINVQGTLLTSPNIANWNVWEQHAIQSDEYFYGWLYGLTKREAKDMLKKLAGDGIDVQLILENNQYQDYGKSRQHINEEIGGISGLNFKSDEHLGLNFNHTKTFISDEFAFIQSANLTQSAFASNTEHFFITDNQVIRENLVSLFDKDWNGNHISIDDIQPNLLVCPIDCRAKIMQMIEHAQNSIYIYHQYLKDEALTLLLKQKITEWLDVRLVLSDTESNYLLVRDWWSDVVRIQEKPYVHTKIIVIDEQYAILGSMNLSSNALDNNREIGIILTDKALIGDLVDQIK